MMKRKKIASSSPTPGRTKCLQQMQEQPAASAGKTGGTAWRWVRFHRDLPSTCQLHRGHPTLVSELIKFLEDTKTVNGPRTNACTQPISKERQHYSASVYLIRTSNMHAKPVSAPPIARKQGAQLSLPSSVKSLPNPTTDSAAISTPAVIPWQTSKD